MAQQDERTDEQLMAALVEGEESAFDVLVARYRGRLYHIALAITGDAAIAEDVLQETLLAVYRSASTFRGVAFRAWLFTIARHQATRTRRRPIPIPIEDDALASLGEAAGWGASDDLGEKDLQDRLARALAGLDAADREILVLRDLEERSGHETAEALEITVQAMKSRLHRARLRLAAALRGEHHA